LIARAVLQLNVFMLGMPMKNLVGLFAIMTILPGLVRIYITVFFRAFPLILLADFGEKTEINRDCFP
jgi:flagellar biosynthesis protein FliR/FlhB